MKPFTLSITQSLAIVLCYLSLAAHLTSAIWSSDRPKSRNKVSVAATARGTKQNVGLIDEAMKAIGLDEFFGTYDTDNDVDDDSDESVEYKVKYSNAKRYSDDSTNENSTSIKHEDRKSNNKRTTNNSSNNNNRSKGEQDKPASSFYSDIESAFEQASDKVESPWLQFKQGVYSLMPDLSHHHENGNDGEEQIKPITILETTEAIETTTERPIITIPTRQIQTLSTTKEGTTTTTEKPPIITATTTAIKIITDNPLTNGTTESSNAPAEATTTEPREIEAPPSSENLNF